MHIFILQSLFFNLKKNWTSLNDFNRFYGFSKIFRFPKMIFFALKDLDLMNCNKNSVFMGFWGREKQISCQKCILTDNNCQKCY